MTFIHVGASRKAIREGRKAILKVLEATDGRGECVALAALETLRVIGHTNATIRDCTFNGGEPPKAIEVPPATPFAGVVPKRDDWPLEYPYDQPGAAVDQGRPPLGPAVEVREETAPTFPRPAPAGDAVSTGSVFDEIAPPAQRAAEQAVDDQAPPAAGG